MGAQRRNVDGFAAAVMLLLCIIWGFQQVAIKAAAHDMAPIMQVALRCGISAFLVAAFMCATKQPLFEKDGTLKAGLGVGALFALEFFFIAKGLDHTTASHMVIFLYTAPIFTALGLHLTVAGEQLTPRQWAGIGTAFCGIVTAFAGGFLKSGVSSEILVGDFLAILGGAFWAATTVIIRSTRLSEAAPGKTLIYQLASACVVLLACAAAMGRSAVTMTQVAWASLLFQGVVVSFASYLTWFWLLRRYLASRLSAFSFMTPLFGVSFGVLLLHEPVDRYFACGAALVLAGITLVSVPSSSRSCASDLVEAGEDWRPEEAAEPE